MSADVPGPRLPAGVPAELSPDAVVRYDAALGPILARYPPEQAAAAMIPALRLGQEIFGFCSPAVQRLAAARLGVPVARAEEVASFYTMLHTQPCGRYLVEVCTNVSCSLAGAERIFSHLQEKMGVGNKGTTADGRFTLREVECLASCGTAPAMQVNEEHHERLSVERVDQILGSLS
jgi:NADH-quinone oxidoreductase subunit E